MTLRSVLLGAGMRRRLERRVAALGLPDAEDGAAPVTEADLAALPAPAARQLRFSGAVGRPRDRSMLLRWTGAFRLRPDQRLMPMEAWQYTSAAAVARVFDMRIDVAGVLPMFGVDSYVAGRGRMRGKVLGLVPVADGSGPEYDVSELVTFLDDAVLLAPSMLLRPGVIWTAVDDESYDVALADSGTTVTARVAVDAEGRVWDFTTEDRYAALPGGLVRARWRTPVEGWTRLGERAVPTGGTAVWDLPEGPYEYARLRLDPDRSAWNVPRAGG